METIKNVTQLLVAKDVAASAGEGALATTSNVIDGSVVVTDLKGVILDATSLPAGLAAFKLVANAGGVLLHSDVISQGDVKAYSINTTSPEVQQVDYVGSNGTSGSLDEIASNIYTIRLYIQGSTKADFMQQKIKEGFYKSNTAAASYSQATVAAGLVSSLVANYSREPEQDLSFGVINSGARLALGTGAGTVTFTEGSKAAVFGTAIDDATTNAILGVGDLLAVAVGLTIEVYTVVSIDVPTETAILDRAFQGTTATVANASVGRVLAATAAAADYGVKIAGVDRDFKVGYFKSDVMTWKTTIDFGDNQTTTVVNSVAAYPGVGTYQQVASLEKEVQADNHVYRSHVEGGVIDRAQVASGNTYDRCIVEFAHSLESNIGSIVKSPKSLQVAFENNTAVGDDANTGIAVTLDAILVTAWAVPGLTVQVGNLTA